MAWTVQQSNPIGGEMFCTCLDGPWGPPILLYNRYEGRNESHEQPFFACELGTADEGEYGGRWNQLFCYP